MKLPKTAVVILATFAIVASASGVASAGSGAVPGGDGRDDDRGPEPWTAVAATDTPVVALTPFEAHTSPASVPEHLIQAAKNDLARRLGVPVSALTLKSATPLDWPNSSLGCPEPRLVYLQVITLGFLIVLSYEGKDYEYHSDMKGPPFLCEILPEPPVVTS